MTGGEHYAEAERLLAFVMDTSLVSAQADTLNLAAAQVHATLALAAATAADRAIGPVESWGGQTLTTVVDGVNGGYR